jgi:hypothetical protein
MSGWRAAAAPAKAETATAGASRPVSASRPGSALPTALAFPERLPVAPAESASPFPDERAVPAAARARVQPPARKQLRAQRQLGAARAPRAQRQVRVRQPAGAWRPLQPPPVVAARVLPARASWILPSNRQAARRPPRTRQSFPRPTDTVCPIHRLRVHRLRARGLSAAAWQICARPARRPTSPVRCAP